MTPGPSVRVRLTGRGIVFIALTLAVGLAAISRQSNSLLLLFSVLVGLFVSAALLTLRSGAGLEISRHIPETGRASEPLPVTLRVRNRKRFLPAFCVEAQDRVLQAGRSGPAQPPPLPIPFVRPGERARSTCYPAPRHRGWARFTHLDLTTEFPPGLLRCERRLPLEDQALILPRAGILARRLVDSLLARVETPDLLPIAAARGSSDFAGVREYRPGDNPRWIHWKLTARQPERTFVKEFEDARVRDALILLETFVPSSGDLPRLSRLERAVSFCVALTDALLAREFRVRVRAFAPELLDLRIEPRRGALAELEHALALLAPSRDRRVETLMPAEEGRLDSATVVLRIAYDELALPADRLFVLLPDQIRSMLRLHEA